MEVKSALPQHNPYQQSNQVSLENHPGSIKQKQFFLFDNKSPVICDQQSSQTMATQANTSHGHLVLPKQSIFEDIAKVFPASIRSIFLPASAKPEVASTGGRGKVIENGLETRRTERSVSASLIQSLSLANDSPIIGEIAKFYPAGINSSEYQFSLKAINSSPLLLSIINQHNTPIRLTEDKDTWGAFIKGDYPLVLINKAVIDKAYQLSIAPRKNAQTEGIVDFLQTVGHEYGHAAYHLGESLLEKTFEDKKIALINSLSKQTTGLNGLNVQQIADDIVTASLVTEGYAAILAWNIVIDATGTLAPHQYETIAHSKNMTLNPDSTITPTVENVLERSRHIVQESDFYRNLHFFSGGMMTYLVNCAKPGDVMKLSGYDANRIQGFGFIKKEGEANTFIFRGSPFLGT